MSNPVAATVMGATWMAAAAADWRLSRTWPVSHLYYVPIALGGALFGWRSALPLAVLSAGTFVAIDFAYLSRPLTEADVIRLALFAAVAVIASILRGDAQQLSAAAASLDQANTELARLNQGLQTEQRQRVQYVARAAHDLAQPLTAMKAGADLLLRMDQPDCWVMQRELAAISANGRRTANMLENLIEAARLEGGGIKLHLKDGVDIGDLAREAAQTFGSAERRDIKIEVGSEVPRIRADERHLLRLLLNIVGNAVKYSPPASPVCVSITCQDKCVRIVVDDQGVGMAASELKDLMKPFVRSAGAERTHGFGLGLPISREIVDGHGGRLEIESTLGGGTSVNIVLPVAGP